jgi:hypothetical protein
MAAIALAMAGCVSVNIGPKSGEHSKGVDYQSPAEPYKTLKDATADRAWINKVSGDSISFFSTCNDPADPSLETVARDLFSGLSELNVGSQTQPTYNGREGLRMEVVGKVDGVPTQVSALIFKKNGCTYTLSHVGTTRTFGSDKNTFEEFLRNFHAP